MFLNVINAIDTHDYSITIFLSGRLIVHEATFENDKPYTLRYLNNAIKPVQEKLKHIMILLETDDKHRFYYSPHTGRFENKLNGQVTLEANGAIAELFSVAIENGVDLNRVEGASVEYYPEAKRPFNKTGKVPLLKFWSALAAYTTGYVNQEKPRYGFFMKLLDQWYYARYDDLWTVTEVAKPYDEGLEVAPAVPEVTPLEPRHVFGEHEFYVLVNCLSANGDKHPGAEEMSMMLGQLANADVGVGIERKNALGLGKSSQAYRIEYGDLREVIALEAEKEGNNNIVTVDAAIPALTQLVNTAIWKDHPFNPYEKVTVTLQLYLPLGDNKALIAAYTYGNLATSEGWVLNDVKKIKQPDGLGQSDRDDGPRSKPNSNTSELLGLVKERWKYPEHLVAANNEFSNIIEEICGSLIHVNDFEVRFNMVGVDTFIYLEKHVDWVIAVRFTASKVKLFYRDIFHNTVVEDSLMAGISNELIAGYVVNKLREIALD